MLGLAAGQPATLLAPITHPNCLAAVDSRLLKSTCTEDTVVLQMASVICIAQQQTSRQCFAGVQGTQKVQTAYNTIETDAQAYVLSMLELHHESSQLRNNLRKQHRIWMDFYATVFRVSPFMSTLLCFSVKAGVDCIDHGSVAVNAATWAAVCTVGHMDECQLVHQVLCHHSCTCLHFIWCCPWFGEYRCKLSMSCACAAVGCTPDLLRSRAQLPTLSRLARHLVVCCYHGWQLQR